MPWGLPDVFNTTEHNAKMERCVQDVMGRQGIDKSGAAAICKKSLGYTNVKAAKKRAGMRRGK